MTQTYSTQTIAQELAALGLPFASFLSGALVALLTGRKASLQQIAALLPGAQNAEAKRQQLRRLLDQPALCPGTWAQVIAKLLPPGRWVHRRVNVVLALDRTEWKLGAVPINVLVLSVVCHGCAVPLFWTPLDKAGASDTAERIALLRQFLASFGRARLCFVTADREFIGRNWVAWLLQQKVPFRIRIKAGEWLEADDGREKRAAEWFASRACACKQRRMLLWGLPVYVGGKRLRRGRSEYLIVISNEPGDLLEHYRLRWKIETLFQALKGRGFDLESSRLGDPVRLGAFFGFLSLALVWCLRMGEFLERGHPLRLKNHGRRLQSLFRRGLDHLQGLLTPLCGQPRHERFVLAIAQLRPT